MPLVTCWSIRDNRVGVTHLSPVSLTIQSVCSRSLAELRRVKTLFPDISGDRILFTPNFATRAEFEGAFKLFEGAVEPIHVTIDNTWVLENWGELFQGKSIFLRIDPGEDGHGHHAYVFTGSSSKFGIEIPEVRSEKFQNMIAKFNITVEGLHMHKGSGILDPTQWERSAKLLTTLRDVFPHLKYVDCGGGLGVPYKPEDPDLSLKDLNDCLGHVTTAHPDLEFWIEPGRYIVAQAGVLLVRVTQLKSKGPHRFVGVNAGMNTLIRPALYESYHHIVNLSRFEDRYLAKASPKAATLEDDLKQFTDLTHDFSHRLGSENKAESRPLRVDIVGPICETGDFLGRGRVLPSDTQEGDVILVDNAGAYGYVMANNYNLRGPGPEQLIEF